jgi:hypothetical protein
VDRDHLARRAAASARRRPSDESPSVAPARKASTRGEMGDAWLVVVAVAEADVVAAVRWRRRRTARVAGLKVVAESDLCGRVSGRKRGRKAILYGRFGLWRCDLDRDGLRDAMDDEGGDLGG